ncbi:chemotaxis protein CheW [Gilvimarinus chinensis]|uniref:chemotaxis protein CheW n=1 Tax=Gilvimarinus chinensis TaxID=396005 RepID=UPI0003655C7F|nr:chemotaxis protein CheW [Gilvimarinus chinensis]
MSLQPDDLLQTYLDDLLVIDASEAEPIKPVSSGEITDRKALSQKAATEDDKRLQLQKLLHSAKLQVAQVVDAPASEELETELTADTTKVLEASVAEVEESHPELNESALAVESLQQELAWSENGRPQWAQDVFEVLLFKVCGLTLAVPLITLGQITPLTDELTPLFGQADWFMGLQPTPSGKVRTVNTAKFVMPERYDSVFEQTAKYVISINGVPWGLAVDTVEQPIRLSPEDVKWRTERSQRPWLAGTVKEHMCALLDIPQMGGLLTRADKNAR